MKKNVKAVDKDSFNSSYLLLGNNSKIIIQELKKFSSVTYRELTHHLGWERHALSPRITELLRAGMVVDVGIKRCNISGQVSRAISLPKYCR